MECEYVLELKSVSKAYTKGGIQTHALRNISLGVNRGEFVSITGPSGSGKSTLLNVIGLLDDYGDGEYFLKQRMVSQLSNKEKAFARNACFGFVFQSFNLIESLSIAENVALPMLYLDGGVDSKFLDRRVREVLELVGISSCATFKPSEISGGQQQRAAIARALVNKPDVILADEPTGNLDSVNGKSILDLLKSLNESGTSICMVTHDLKFAGIADRNIRISDVMISSAEV